MGAHLPAGAYTIRVPQGLGPKTAEILSQRISVANQKVAEIPEKPKQRVAILPEQKPMVEQVALSAAPQPELVQEAKVETQQDAKPKSAESMRPVLCRQAWGYLVSHLEQEKGPYRCIEEAERYSGIPYHRRTEVAFDIVKKPRAPVLGFFQRKSLLAIHPLPSGWAPALPAGPLLRAGHPGFFT